MTSSLRAIFATQDQLITRQQALKFLTDDEIATRLGREWLVVMPGIYAASGAALTSRQRLQAALLHAGPTAMLSDTWALQAHRVPFVPNDRTVRVLVAADVQRLSRDFVVIRRTTRAPQAVLIDGLPVAPVCRAVCEFILRHGDQRDGLAVAAAAVQTGRVTLAELLAEAHAGAARGRPRLMRILDALAAGVRSAPEEDFRQLVRRTRTLPEPAWNWLIELPDGQCISPDALWLDSAVIHEVNGRRYHAPELAGEDAFADMQRRHDALVAAGFTVLHNPPSRITGESRSVIAEVRACLLRGAGRGLPAGVRILRSGPPGMSRSLSMPSDVTLHGISA